MGSSCLAGGCYVLLTYLSRDYLFICSTTTLQVNDLPERLVRRDSIVEIRGSVLGDVARLSKICRSTRGVAQVVNSRIWDGLAHPLHV
jgi:hypothetical protein